MRLPERELSGRFQGPMTPDACCLTKQAGDPGYRRRSLRLRWALSMPGPQELVFARLAAVGEIGMNLSIYGIGDQRRRTWLAVDFSACRLPPRSTLRAST